MASKARRIGGDWVESTDPASGKVYYANMKTKETSWTMPEEVKRFQEATVAKQKAAAKAKATGSGAAAEDQWLERQDPKTGRIYYYNPKLKQTSWTRPDQTITAASTDPNFGKGAWVARIDPRTNRTYYYNQVTKLTSWTNPDEEEDKPAAGKGARAKSARASKAKSSRSAAGGGGGGGVMSRLSKRLSKDPSADAEPAFQGAGPAAPTNRTSARTSVRLGEMGAPTKGSRLSMADVARQKKAEKAAKAAENGGEPVDFEKHTEVKTAPLADRFAKLRALRERAQQGAEAADEVHEKQIDIENLAASAMAEVTYDLKMENYAEQYFQLKRKGFSKAPTTLDKILSWKPDKIKTSLHPLGDPALVHDAVLAFTNILHYMGDKPSKNPMANAQKVFLITVGCPEELRDEIFCQLVKQTTNNPDGTSCLRGWELLAMCAGLFPPSTKLEKYLLSYLRRATEAQPYPGVGKLAEYALLRVQRSLELGPRSEAPTEVEIEAVRQIQPVGVNVHMLDGAILTMEAESWTTVREMNLAMAKALRIKDPTPFSLFEVNNLDEERALEEEDRVLDVLAYWARERKQARRAKDKPSFQFVYKVRLFFDIKEDDEAAVEVAYHQAVHDVTDSRYPCTEEDAFRLAALMAQERFGDYFDDGEDKFGDELQAFLPAKFYDDSIVDALKAEITEVYKLLKGYDRFEAMNNYLDYVKSWKMYGCAFFFVEPQNSRDFPPDAVLAVNAKGVLVIDPHTKDIISDWPYSEVVTWGHSAITFVLVAGNLIRSTKYYFKTDQGPEINSLVHAYVDRLAASD